MSKITVLIANSEEIPLAGLVAILRSGRETEVCETVDKAERVVTAIRKSKPDVVLISAELNDIALPAVLKQIRESTNNPPVVVIAHTPDPARISQALKAGAKGYLLYSAGKPELTKTLQKVIDGEHSFCEEVLRLISDKYVELKRSTISDQPSPSITNREREVLRLVIDGYTSQEIAKLLYISPRTVETHRANLLSKLNMKNTAGLIRYALEEGEV